MTPPFGMSLTTTGPPRDSGSSNHERSSVDGKQSSRQENGNSKDSVSSSKGSTADDGGEELSKDIIWEHMFDELKAIKEKTGTCNLPDKKGRLAKWVYAQRKAFRRLQFSRGTATTRARLEKLESIGFEFSSSSYVAWDVMFEKYKKRNQGKVNDDEARKLKLWMSNQRLEYSRQRRGLPNNITPERIAKLEAVGFQWVGRTGKPNLSTTDGDDTNSLYSRDGKRESEEVVPSQKPPKKRKHGGTSGGSEPSKRCVTSEGSTFFKAPSKGHEFGQNRSFGGSNERDRPVNDAAGSLLHVLAALKQATAVSYPVATDALTKKSAAPLGRDIRQMSSAREEHDEDDDDDVSSDVPASDSSCSWCDEAPSAVCCKSQENSKLKHSTKASHRVVDPIVSPFRRKGEKVVPRQSSASYGTDSSSNIHANRTVGADRPFAKHKKHSKARKVAEAALQAAAASIVTDGTSMSSSSSPSKQKKKERRFEWPVAANMTSASLRNAYMASLPEESVHQGDSLARHLSNNDVAFIPLPTGMVNGGGLFIPDFLTSAAVQEQLRQQHASAALASNDLYALLPLLGGNSGRFVAPSLHGSLYPIQGTLAHVPSDNPNLGDNLYHPSIAHFIYQR